MSTGEAPGPQGSPGARYAEDDSGKTSTAIPSVAVATSRGPYADAALIYLRSGWRGALPVIGKGRSLPRGFTGKAGVDPDPVQVATWMNQRPADNIVVRMPANVIGIDVDDYGEKVGGKTLAEATGRLGELPAGPVSTSRRDDPVSGIRFFRVPPGRRWKSALGPDVQIIQRTHRYAAVWPSVHPDTGQPYGWYDGDREPLAAPPSVFGGLPDLPEAWIGELDRGEVGEATQLDAATVEQVEKFLATFSDGPPSRWVTEQLEQAKAKLPGGRHDAATAGAVALVEAGERGHPGVVDALDELRTAFVAALNGEPNRDAAHEWTSSLGWAVAQVASRPRTPEYERWKPEPAVGTLHGAEGAAESSNDPQRLPEAFWSPPELDHVRQAAYARGLSPEAVWGAASARVAAGLPWRVKLPANPERSGLSMAVVLLGPPGVGKSSAKAVATEVIPAGLIPPSADGVPPGSGEGLVELLFEEEKVPDPSDETGKRKITIKVQARYNAYVYVDEGAALAALGNRDKSILWPTIRTMVTDGVLGQANATKATWRVVPAGNYVYGVVIGFQDGLTDKLLGEQSVQAGTPARLVWLAADTYTPPPGERPDFPGPLKLPDYTLPPVTEDGWHFLQVANEVREEVERDNYGRRTDPGRDPLDAHASLLRLKQAGVIAMMAGRVGVIAEDWWRAGMVWAASVATRQRAIRSAGEADYREQWRYGSTLGLRKLAADATVASARADDRAKVSQRVLDVLDTADGPVNRSDLVAAVTARLRPQLDSVLDALVETGQVEVDVDTYRGRPRTRYRRAGV